MEGGLGIRALTDIISAFTVKLNWRLRSQTTLWSSFLYQKYIKGAYPFTGSSSVHASTTWKRMQAASKWNLSNTFWNIGEGNIFFWQDWWTGNGPLLELFPQHRNSRATVKEFWSQGKWDEGKLARCLPTGLVQVLLNTPISMTGVDTPRWKSASNGDFSTKDAWELCRKTNSIQLQYQLIWSKNIQPTISIFMWRLLSNWLPVDCRMQQKGIQLASRCQCCSQTESVQHVFFTSPEARKVWEFFGNWMCIALPDTLAPMLMLQFWNSAGYHAGPGHIKSIIPIFTWWFLWKARNDSKYRGIKVNHKRIIWKVVNHLQNLYRSGMFTARQWTGYRERADLLGIKWHRIQQSSPIQVLWQKPTLGWVKLNTDGSCRGQPRRAAIGGLIRDSKGRIIQAFHKQIGKQTNTAAEIQAIWEGLKMCIDSGFQRIWVETDSRVAIQLIGGNSKGHWEVQHVITHIQNLLARAEVQISHIFREGNKAADFLASMDGQEDVLVTFDANSIPNRLKSFAYWDNLNYPNFRFP